MTKFSCVSKIEGSQALTARKALRTYIADFFGNCERSEISAVLESTVTDISDTCWQFNRSYARTRKSRIAYAVFFHRIGAFGYDDFLDTACILANIRRYGSYALFKNDFLHTASLKTAIPIPACLLDSIWYSHSFQRSTISENTFSNGGYTAQVN